MTTGSRVWFGPLPWGGIARSAVKSRKKERTRGIQNVQRRIHAQLHIRKFKVQNKNNKMRNGKRGAIKGLEKMCIVEHTHTRF